MINYLKKTKFWWWLPLVGIFCIQDVACWVDDVKELEHEKRIKVFYLIYIVQFLYIVSMNMMYFYKGK
jgi:hypothetical protein